MLPKYITKTKVSELAIQSNISEQEVVDILKKKGHQIEGVNTLKDEPKDTKKKLNTYQVSQILKDKTKEESAQTLTQLSKAGYTTYDNNSILGWVGNKAKKLSDSIDSVVGKIPGYKTITDPNASWNKVGAFSADATKAVAGFGLGAAQQAFDITGSALKATDMINPVSYASKALGVTTPTFGEATQQASSDISSMYKDIAPKGTETSQEVGKVGLAALGTMVGGKIIGGSSFTSSLLKSPVITNFIKESPKIAKALGFLGTSGAYTTGYKALKDQEVPTAAEFAVGAVLDGLMLGGGKILGALFPKTLKGKAVRTGVPEKAVNEVAELDQSGVKFAKDLLEQSKKNYESFTKTGQFIESPYDLVAKDVNVLDGQLKQIKEEIGGQISQLTSQLKNKAIVSTHSVAEDLVKIFDEKNIKINNDLTLNWSDSAHRHDKSVKQVFEEIWNKVKPEIRTTKKWVQNPEVDMAAPRLNDPDFKEGLVKGVDWIKGSTKEQFEKQTKESFQEYLNSNFKQQVNQQMANSTRQARDLKGDLDYVGNVLFENKTTKEYSTIEEALNRIWGNYRTTLDSIDGQLGEYMRNYSDLIESTRLLNKRSGEEGEMVTNVVKGLFPSSGGTNAKNKFIIEKLTEQAKKFNIEGSDELLTKLSMAKIADDVYKAAQETSGTTFNQAGQMMLLPKRNVITKGVQAIEEALYGSAPDVMKQLLDAVQAGQSLDYVPWYRELPQSLKMLFRSIVQNQVTGEASSDESPAQGNISQKNLK